MEATTFCAILLLAVSSAVKDPLIVSTTGGMIKGFEAISRSGKTYYAFTNIPFAKPPVDSLRFMPPEEPEPWEGIRQSDEPKQKCIQYNSFQTNATVEGVEDCLYLSVFTRRDKCLAPVMVHIHGGTFITGAGLNSDQMKYLMDEKVVVVDIEYRLGVMGFLSFEDEYMPGNQGMKDQTMALRWVKENIAKFGGNPRKVTIFGENAGAASVYHHTVSPLSKGLFHRAIGEGGASYNPWALLPPKLARSRAHKLASLLCCPLNTTTEAVECMLKKDAEELVGTLAEFKIWEAHPLLLFQPVLESPGPGAFLVGPISEWKHSKVPLLIGMTSTEGILLTENFIQYNLSFESYNDNFFKLAPISMLYATASDPDKITSKIKEFYCGNRNITSDDFFNLTNAYTDSWFTRGIIEAANRHGGRVYLYYFDNIEERPFFNLNDTQSNGTGPAEAVTYLYSNTCLEGQNLALSVAFVKLWTRFAKTGRASSPTKNEVWKKWTEEKQQYMHINHSGFYAAEYPLKARYDLWRQLEQGVVWN